MSANKQKKLKIFLSSLGRKDLSKKIPVFMENWQYTQFINSNCKLSFSEKDKMLKIINKE